MELRNKNYIDLSTAYPLCYRFLDKNLDNNFLLLT